MTTWTKGLARSGLFMHSRNRTFTQPGRFLLRPTFSSWSGKGGILQSVCLEGCRISPLLQRITRKNWGNGWSGTNRLVVNRLLRTKSDTRTNRQRFLWSSSKQRLSTVGRVVPREVNHFNEKVGLVGSMNCYLRNRMHPTPSALKASITKLLWWKDHLVFKLLGVLESCLVRQQL